MDICGYFIGLDSIALVIIYLAAVQRPGRRVKPSREVFLRVVISLQDVSAYRVPQVTCDHLKEAHSLEEYTMCVRLPNAHQGVYLSKLRGIREISLQYFC